MIVSFGKTQRCEVIGSSKNQRKLNDWAQNSYRGNPDAYNNSNIVCSNRRDLDACLKQARKQGLDLDFN